MSYKNQICELYFLLYRNNISEIGSRLSTLLKSLKSDLKDHSDSESQSYIDNRAYLKTLYLLIGHVRDIYFGHGERDIAYMMIYVWYKFYPTLAIYAFHKFVINDRGSPFGCWNDIKYFCKFISQISDKGSQHPLIDIAVSCANNQLRMDYKISNVSASASASISNLSKWIPRENKIKWLFEKLVSDWFSLNNENIDFSYQKKIYRQMIARNCNHFANYPNTISNLFQKITSNDNGINNIYDISNNTIEKKVSTLHYFYDNVFIGMYIKSAIAIIKKCQANALDIDTYPDAIWLNRKWSSLVTSFLECHGGIPLVDTALDISNESLYHAIGFACLVAVKSGIFRILLVSKTPIWIEFTNNDSICSIVDKVWSFCEFRSGSHFSLSFDFLIDAISKNKIDLSMKLFIFSQRFLFDWNDLFIRLKGKCSIIFWNIGSFLFTDMVDFHIDTYNEVLFVSGFGVSLFAKFCCENLHYYGSYSFLLDCLYSTRYKVLSDYFDSQVI
jgi:hypothetical protein